MKEKGVSSVFGTAWLGSLAVMVLAAFLAGCVSSLPRQSTGPGETAPLNCDTIAPPKPQTCLLL